MTTIKSLVGIVVKNGWSMYHLDVNDAFLHGDLHEKIYMKPPRGPYLPDPNLICKLIKSLMA